MRNAALPAALAGALHPASHGYSHPLQFGSSYDRFSGCGGGGYWDATWVEFKNNMNGQQAICLDLVRLLA